MTSRTLVRLLVFGFALSILASGSAQTLTYRPTVRGTRGVVARTATLPSAPAPAKPEITGALGIRAVHLR